MRRFFISSHGHLASGLKSSLEILLGKADNVTVFDAYVDQRSVESQVEAFLETVNEQDQAILISDLYGGSVNQVLYRYINRPNTMLVTGVNLALVLELAAMSDAPLSKEELNQIIQASKETMQLVEMDLTETAQEDFF